MTEQTLTPAQCRAGRALLGWSQPQLATAAKIGLATVQDFETGKRAPHGGTLVLLCQAFEAAGIELIGPADGKGTGVRLAKHGS